MSMRPTRWLITLALLNAGCSLVSDGVHVVGYRTRRALDDSREWHRDCRLAAAAWAEAGDQARGRSADYADGFKEGFAAHLFRGTCEPPPLAPARYRSVRAQTAAGYQAAEDWLNGFRHGVAEAQRRGLRDLVTGPSALRTAAPPEAGPVPTTPAPLPLPSPEPVPPVVAPAAARAVSPSLAENLPPYRPHDVKTAEGRIPTPLPPPRPTMQQVVRNRLAIAPSPAGSGVADPAPAPPPQPADELAPRWTSTQAPAPEVVWRRSDESGVWRSAGTRGPRAEGDE